jgi:hypothetical protein
MSTERPLQAEWRQVLRGSVSTGQSKMSQVLGAFGLLDFTMLELIRNVMTHRCARIWQLRETGEWSG